MNILSIDTTTKVASVAIYKNDKIIENSISNEITHSEKLLPLIDSTLKEANLTLKDINIYATINGPGSFTGIRIGLATLKAFSMIDGKNIFSMPSTTIMAYKSYVENIVNNFSTPTYVASLIDARNDRVYYSLNKIYKDNNNKVHIEEILNTSNELINSSLDKIYYALKDIDNLNVIISGDCVNNYHEKIINKINNAVIYNTYPTPSDLINAYFNIYLNNEYIFDTYTLDATYARASQAERIRNNEK